MAEIESPIRNFLEAGVLYSSARLKATAITGYVGKQFGLVGMPGTLTLRCLKCDLRTVWELQGARADSPGSFPIGQIIILRYRCRNCENRSVQLVIFSTKGSNEEADVVLVGRVPRANPSIAPELEAAFRERTISLHHYSNALADRADGRGIGAMSYLRRVVEDEFNTLLNFLISELRSDPEKINQLRAAEQLQGKNAFVEKARVADAVLPSTFFPGQQNPFIKLHDLCSDGVHNLDDVESCERFDEANGLFELLIVRLRQMAESQRVYEDKLKKLTTRKS